MLPTVLCIHNVSSFITIFMYIRESVYIICCWSICWWFAFKPPFKVSTNCHECSSWEANIRGGEPKVSSESSQSDWEEDVVSKTSHWSSALESALGECYPCFNSLSIPHSSLASTSLLHFKELHTAFDIQLKFLGSFLLPLNTCFSLRYLSWIPVLSPTHPIWLSALFLFSEKNPLSSLKFDSFLSALILFFYLLSYFRHLVFLCFIFGAGDISTGQTHFSHIVCVGQTEKSSEEFKEHCSINHFTKTSVSSI